MILLAVVAGGLLLRSAGRPGRPPSPRVADVDSLELALLLRIGLSSGLSLSGTLDLLAAHAGPATRSLVRRIGRQGVASGLTSALASQSDGPRNLLRLLADAHLSGAPVVFAVNTFINDELERRRAAALHRARVLPVRLALPVALGLLPGFVLLGIAPQIVLALRDLLGQVAGL